MDISGALELLNNEVLNNARIGRIGYHWSIGGVASVWLSFLMQFLVGLYTIHKIALNKEQQQGINKSLTSSQEKAEKTNEKIANCMERLAVAFERMGKDLKDHETKDEAKISRIEECQKRIHKKLDQLLEEN